MVNRSKAKGTTAETATVRWLRDNGFPGADRQPLRGNRDGGDLTLAPGIIAEVKNYAGAPSLGQPPAKLLTTWLGQATVEAANAGADHCLLVVKRAGTTDPSRWWCYLTMTSLVALLGGDIPQGIATHPVCMSLESATALLRAAGWGDPITTEAA